MFVTEANGSFGGDWWRNVSVGSSQQTYESKINSSVLGKNDSSETFKPFGDGYIQFSNTKYDDYTIDGKIFVMPRSEGKAGYWDTDPLNTIGYDEENRTLTITLPYNQGTATVAYVNVVVHGDRTSDAKYVVTFDKAIGKEESITAESYEIADSDSVTRVFSN